MGYISEAKRLGLPEFIPAIVRGLSYSGKAYDAEGLCVTGCTTCLTFRNRVREAQAKERADIFAASRFAPFYSAADLDRAFGAGKREGLKGLDASSAIHDEMAAISDSMDLIEEALTRIDEALHA